MVTIKYMEATQLIKARLTEAIRYSGIRVTEIATRLGVSHSVISQYCTTKKFPALDTFARLCKILDVSADYILGLS